MQAAALLRLSGSCFDLDTRQGCARWHMTCSAKRQTRRETFLLGICIVETGIAAIWTAMKLHFSYNLPARGDFHDATKLKHALSLSVRAASSR